MKNGISEAIVGWYMLHKRDLPWRKLSDAYLIWISEIILQQTRVVQGLPYFYRFMENFPDVQALANAEEKEILRCWQGLGYYSRARNMHHTAKVVVEKYGGIFPKSYSELIKLKGIGSYTAAAIASFCSNENVAVLDGNVMRVIARLFNLDDDIAQEKTRKKFQAIATDLLLGNLSSIHNQAMMEFGALQCVPASPNCGICELQHLCEAFRHKTQHKLPVKSKKLKIKTRYLNYFVFTTPEKKYYMKTRSSSDIWQGLYDFYCIETDTLTISYELLIAKMPVNANSNGFIFKEATNDVKHVLTHQIIYAKFWVIEVDTLSLDFVSENNLLLLSSNEVHEIPKPVLVKNFFDKFIFF